MVDEEKPDLARFVQRIMQDSSLVNSYEKVKTIELTVGNIVEFFNLRRNISTAYLTKTLERFYQAEKTSKLADEKEKELFERAFNRDLEVIFAYRKQAYFELQDAYFSSVESNGLLTDMFDKLEDQYKQVVLSQHPEQKLTEQEIIEIKKAAGIARGIAEHYRITPREIYESMKKEEADKQAELQITQKNSEIADEEKIDIKTTNFIKNFTEAKKRPPSYTETVRARELGGSTGDRSKSIKRLLVKNVIEGLKVKRGIFLKLIT